MNETNGTLSNPREQLRDARAEMKLLEAQLRLRSLRETKRLLEGWVGTRDDFQFGDPWERYRNDQLSLTGPRMFATINDRRQGRNYPIFQTEEELAQLRAPARILCSTNHYAIGLLNGLTSYTIGTGFTYRAVPKNKGLKKTDESVLAQRVIDEFVEESVWGELEQELFWRSREDGEFFLRIFPQSDSLPEVRTVEPEQVRQPPGETQDDWSFGIRTDPDDIQKPLEYFVSYFDNIQDGDFVDPDDMIHCKVNTKRSIKRGLTDFAFSTADSLDVADRLRKALGEGAAIQAAIAEIVQYESATNTQVQSLIDSQKEYSRTSPVTGRTTAYERIPAGTRRHIPKGMTYVAPPGATNIPGYVEALQACLRGAGVRWNAPEWLASADASNNNFASSLTAESPFVLSVLRAQAIYKRLFKKVLMRVLELVLGADLVKQVEIQVEAPPVESRDRLAEAQTDQIYVGMGVKSVQTTQQEQGLDSDQENQNRETYAERFGTPGMGLEMPQEGDDANGRLPGSPGPGAAGGLS